MTSLWEQGPWRTVLTAFILLLLADDVVADDSTYWTFRILRILGPVIVLLIICGSGGYCCRRRRNRQRAEQAARAESGNQAGWGWGQGTGTQPADGQTPPYVISNGAYTGPPSYGYATNYNTVFTGSLPTDANKTGPDLSGEFSAPPPSYDDVIKQKASDTVS